MQILSALNMSGAIMIQGGLSSATWTPNAPKSKFSLTVVAEVAKHRLRPILLTAAAAVQGPRPIARRLFWGLMACAAIDGVDLATLIRLVVLPTLHLVRFSIRSRNLPDS